MPQAEKVFEQYLKAYRGQGYWIPELNQDVDVDTIRSLLPEWERKLIWIEQQKQKIEREGLPRRIK